MTPSATRAYHLALYRSSLDWPCAPPFRTSVQDLGREGIDERQFRLGLVDRVASGAICWTGTADQAARLRQRIGTARNAAAFAATAPSKSFSVSPPALCVLYVTRTRL